MVVFDDLFFDWSVGDFGGTLVEQSGARHDDSVLGICLNNFADVGKASYEDSGHLDIIVGDGSGSLEDELELALGGAGIVVEDFPKFFVFLPVCFIASFIASMRLKGFSISSGLLFSRRAWRVSVYMGCLASRWGIGLWSLGIWRLVVMLVATGAW